MQANFLRDLFFFLFIRNSSCRWWEQVLWHLWIGRARHSTRHLAVEVFNGGRWLTHGDLALEAQVDFIAVVEHRLILARCAVSGPAFGARVWLQFGRQPRRSLLMLVMRTAFLESW